MILNPFAIKVQEICVQIENEEFAPHFKYHNKSLGHLMVMQPWIDEINRYKIWGSSSMAELRKIIKQENLSPIDVVLESIKRREQEIYNSIV